MMRPRNLLYASTAGAVALCCVLSQPTFARLQLGGEQPPSIVPKYDAPRNGSTPGNSIPDELWKGDRNRSSNSGEQTGKEAFGPGPLSQPSYQAQTPTQQPTPSQPQPVPQSQSTLRLANHFPPNSQSQANHQNQIGNGAGQSNSASGNLSRSNSASGPQTGSVVPASYDASRTQSRTVLQPKSKSDDASKSKSSGGTMQMLISVMSSLAIVIGLFIGVAYLYRKSISTTLGKGLPKNVVQVLGRTTIAPRQQLVVVRFGSKLVLVSMLQGEARTISEITDPIEVDQLSGFCESSQSSSITSSFREILTQGVKA